MTTQYGAECNSQQNWISVKWVEFLLEKKKIRDIAALWKKV